MFFEESLERLDVLEAGWMRLGSNSPDSETVHDVFRAAHSIKGAAGTFGFSALVEMTHLVETLLVQLRSHKREATPSLVQTLLGSADGLRCRTGALLHCNGCCRGAQRRACQRYPDPWYISGFGCYRAGALWRLFVGAG